ncbi:MAG: tetratricopeptide repeat protein [Pseudomonadota bacterium]|nr:tetratricopeptide repeat protein [Pseudomonadota bacterium]
MSRVVSLGEAFREAFAHEAAGREAQALAVYQRILAAVPNHPGALLRIAEMEIRQGERLRGRARLDVALEAATAMRLPGADILTALGRLERSEGNYVGAQTHFEEALRDTPMHAAAMLELGVMEHVAGDFAVAETRFRAVTQSSPELGIAWLQLGLALEHRGDLAAARVAAATAITARNTSAAAWEHAGRMAIRAGDYSAAEALCMQGLVRYVRNPGLMHQQGILLKLTGQPDAACGVLEDAAALAPQDAGVRLSLGAACLDARRATDALRHLQEAIALGGDTGEVWDNLGMARLACGDADGAEQAFERAIILAPRLTPAIANLVHLRQQSCAWVGLSELQDMLRATLKDEAGDTRWPPFVALGMDLTASEQLRVSQRWSSAMLPPVRSVSTRTAQRTESERLRVAYLGNDFREHATGRLMAGLFEAHDRTRFEVHAYSYGPDDGSALQKRIMAAFEHWHDVTRLSDADIAQRIRDDGIDVLIDCKGHTRGGRLAILASRPAPVQLHYMGFPGSIGYDAVDGLIADAEVVPLGHEVHFKERVWRLPRCYFVNDDKREVPAAEERTRHGLADSALVLACFNQPYKITAPIFSTWMTALRVAPTAVLWLLATSEAQQRNLTREAERAGVAAQRLVFAAPMTPSSHMARVGCADLALDTLPVNQHTTACDALWAGVPVLTLRGNTFAGRVGASVLKAVDLPDLITDSLDEYSSRLLALVRDPRSLARYRSHLIARRGELALFDTCALARDWEQLLTRAYEVTVAKRK